MTTIKKAEKISLYYALSPLSKLIICLVVGIAVYFIFPLRKADNLSRIVLAWDAFCFSSLVIYWVIFINTKPEEIRTFAAKEDPSRIVMFIITLIAASASMLAVVLLLTAAKQTIYLKIVHTSVGVLGSILSWFIVHTVFAVRYAHLYYDDDDSTPSKHKGGLEFPKEDKPDFFDFAYFSFILGMTFQVSDVSVSSRKLRRIVLWHSLISFAYNVVIIALTINVIANLGGN